MLVRVEGALQVEEEGVEVLQQHRTRAGGQDARAPLDDLQPLLDVHLQP